MRILTVVGNRPQFIKAAAVSHELRAVAEEVLVHTGQHYDPELSDVFFEELDVPPPEHRLDTGGAGHAAQTGTIMAGLEELVGTTEPDGLLIYGDTNSTLAGALVGAKAHLPIAHVEAGMRSFDRSMPEEVNRVVADHVSTLLLCPTATAVENLEREGLGERTLLVGDVQADVALKIGPVAERRSKVLARLGVEPGSYRLATAHRPGNVDDPERLAALVELLVAAAADRPLVLPVHPRTRARMASAGLDAGLGEGVIVTEPLGYLDFMALVRGASAVITDSGGLQKEAYLAGVPCVTLRDSTEWPETVEAGWNVLVGLDLERAMTAIRHLEDPDAAAGRPPADPGIYGGGNAGARVAEALLSLESRR